MKSLFYLLPVFSIVSFSCEDDPPAAFPLGPDGDSLYLTVAFPNLDFTRLVDLQHAGDNNLYAVEQRGVIRKFENNNSTNTADVFLDISSRVDDLRNEEGLLGLAFHPQYGDNGYFYVNYTSGQSTSRVSRFQVDPSDPAVALPGSELILLEFDQPYSNHNGGQLAFGPDGYLYIAVGDGGSGGDPENNAQNLKTLLGSILRIDVDQSDGILNYSIPADNPFNNNTQEYREEIFAFGLRNPWRISFDSKTGSLYAADVGQGKFEEINIIRNGGNYGWNVLEGPDCFLDPGCSQTDFEAPYFNYEHNNNNLSITGGYVYRGSLGSLEGYYVYADYVSGRIWALSTQSGNLENILLLDSGLSISSFGVDHQSELFVCSLEGTIYRFSN